ncbi:xanthine dehydrogenase family protein molybdopterin-binding subunit [Streptomyces sp. NPDC004237]|uniref:xanthine dehydrogenase family protein molybdopterin-binding subunit n=1 Tax=Streptomyces sp. NPDC004237 TaxID=3154455 RepID=UPI0033A782DE
MSRPDAPDLVRGRGVYFQDVTLPGLTHVFLVRSPHPHARILAVDTTEALAALGVVAVVTGADLADLPEIPHNVDPVGIGGQHVEIRALPVGTVNYAGQPVAAVVARTPADAAAAAPLVRVDYEPLPFVLDADEAAQPGAPTVVVGWTGNVIVAGVAADHDVDPVLAGAAHVINGEIRLHRAGPAPLETRGYMADWDRRAGRLTFWGTAQNPHPLRSGLASALGLPEHRIRVIAPRPGGSFGLKMHGYPEEVLVCALARRLGRPVRWIEDRADCMLVGAREHTVRYTAGADASGRVLALRADVTSNLGAPTGLPGWGMSMVGTLGLPNGYDIAACALTWRAVATNKAPWNGARGYGKELTAVLMERLMDRVAAAAGLDPAEVRRRNWVRRDQFPHPTPTGLQLDSGDYHALLDLLLSRADHHALRAGHGPAGDGLLRGVGLAFEVVPESVDLPGSLVSGAETSTVRMDPEGHTTVLTGATSPGGGSDRGIAQLVAAELGVHPDTVGVVQGDTDRCPYGYGNLSSRSLVAGGGAAVLAARDIAAKLRTVAAAMLHSDPEKIRLSDGFAVVEGAPEQAVPLPAVAHAVHTLAFILALGIDPSLEATRTYRPGNIRHLPDDTGHINPFATYSNALHLCVVDVEEDTGIVHVRRHVVAHDCGTIVNETLVEGQIRGAVAMGIGTALGEHLRYDADGRPLATGFKTYLMARTTDLPRIEVLHQQTPSPFTFNGAKGAGEVGVGGAMAAVVNAVNDALATVGTEIDALPLDPPHVLAALQRGRS